MNTEKLILFGKTGNGQRLGNVYQTEYYSSKGILWLDNDHRDHQLLTSVNFSLSKHTYTYYRISPVANSSDYSLYFIDKNKHELFIGNFESIEACQAIAKSNNTISII